jgi:UDP-xylose/UDP-N-acetylglucosamine transporter B4
LAVAVRACIAILLVSIHILNTALRRNVFALEAVLKSHPNGGGLSQSILYRPVDRDLAPGIFLTFVQFLYVTLETLSTQFTFSPLEGKTKQGGHYWIPRLKPRVVPLRRWIVQVALFLAVSLMNNWAFGLKVPVPIHIIFRSGG